MTSFTKIIFRFLPLGIVLLIAVVYYLSNDYKSINAEESTVELQVFRHRRAINPTPLRYCKFNQYYDQEEGRCLGVPGGGKVLHVENGRSCGVNILKPHCTSLLYYHICKRDKSILAQCASGQIFDNRLQRCAYYDSSKLTPSIIQPDDLKYYEHVKVPDCMRPGRFPVPDHCSMFYTCDTNGHRLHQSVFKCPRNTGYQAIREICAVVSDCENNDSVDSVICVPDAPDDNVESLNSDGTTEENEGISKNSENDSLKREESIQPKSYDDIISAPESITDNPLSIDNGGNDGDLDKASSLPTHPNQDISVSDGEMFNQASNPTESAQEINNEKDDTIPPVGLPSMYSTDINYNIDRETTEQYRNNDDERVTLPNSNTEALDSYSASTISNTPDLSSINDKLKVDEEPQDISSLPTHPNQDISVSDGEMFNQASNPTESAQEINNEKDDTIPPVGLPSMYSTDINSNIDSETTKQYRNNDDERVTLPNSNTEALDSYSASTISNTPDLFSINDKLKVDEEPQDISSLPTHPNQDISVSDGEMFNQASNPTESAQEINNEKDDTISPVGLPSMYSTDINSNIDSETTEQYRNNDDERVTLPNSNTEALDSYPASTISNTPDLSSINDKSLKVDEEPQDMTEAVNSYQTSTISNTPEFPPISGTSSKLYEEMQSVTTEQYGNDDKIMAPSNSNAEMVDQNPTPILSDISATTDSNDFDTLSPTSASAILSPQTDINDDQYATKELFKTSPSVDSKLVDPDLDAPEVIEDGSKHTDTLDLAPTTQPTLTLEHLTASMDITTITPTKQDLPAISDTDLITQNGKDSMEASPFIEQDAPITNN